VPMMRRDANVLPAIENVSICRGGYTSESYR
jgi:hypothetical protein